MDHIQKAQSRRKTVLMYRLKQMTFEQQVAWADGVLRRTFGVPKTAERHYRRNYIREYMRRYRLRPSA